MTDLVFSILILGSVGLIAGVMAGSILSKRIVLALPEKRFMQLMEIVMLISGLSILGQCLYSQ